jgi:large subunit ribosomal protein L15
MWDKKFHVVNLGAIDTHFNDGDTVDPETVKKKGLANGPSDGIRILAKGEFSKKLTVRAHHVSKSAIEKIIAKGGVVEIIPPPAKPVRNKMGTKS